MGTDFQSVRIPEEFAARIILEQYGLKGKVQPLPGEVDFNFRIRTDQGVSLLKVGRPGEDPERIRFQHAILDHLAHRDPSPASPRVIPNLEGDPWSETTDDEGRPRLVRMYSWLEGRPWSEVNPVTDRLLFSLGTEAGKLTRALQGFDHPGAHRVFDWDLALAVWTADHLDLLPPELLPAASSFLEHYASFQETYTGLRKATVHNDANDNNILVSFDLADPGVTALVDYGDAIHTQVINDLAIAIAYGVMGKPDPLGAALRIASGYHSQFPLQEKELEFLHTLVAMRLIISLVKSEQNRRSEPANPYLQVSEAPAKELLHRWSSLNRDLACCSFRAACGFDPHPGEQAFRKWAAGTRTGLNTLLPSLGKKALLPIDLSVSSTWIGDPSLWDDQDEFSHRIRRLQSVDPEAIIGGGYLEPRMVYTTAAYGRQGNHGPETRTVHLGLDLWVPEGTPVHALYDGEVATAVDDRGDKEYGGLVILRHFEGGVEFHTLHGHLSPASIGHLRQGIKVQKGEHIGEIGIPPENGNWVPHLHFQLMLSLLGFRDDFPGVIYPNEQEVWKSICPDPNLLFKLPAAGDPVAPDLPGEVAYRKEHLGRNLSLSYREPLKIVRGSGAFLFDHMGRKYLDTVNNVAHVGHEHPRVVRAGQQQMAVLNTNTRYLHGTIHELTRELLSTFPRELSVVYYVNSGSEANELALRMAETCTGQRDMIAVEMGYHGNTGRCVEVSSYKFDGRGGTGRPEFTHIVPLPDRFRGIYRGEDTGERYASHLVDRINHIRSLGRGMAAFICESIISCGGQIELPGGYLKQAYRAVHEAGGICIADEVQVGIGRVGSAFWGFQLHGVVPDIVTIGKPFGNGHPLAAVVCTREVADAFANGMEYFNTFGGNPVSCAIGLEVLKVIREEGLQAGALETGDYLKSVLKEMQAAFPVIGDIRGQGLFLGIELADGERIPLTNQAAYLVNRMKELGVLMSTDGREENVLKFKPPMVFTREHADVLAARLETVLKEDYIFLNFSNH